jgi:hypothetical protein
LGFGVAGLSQRLGRHGRREDGSCLPTRSGENVLNDLTKGYLPISFSAYILVCRGKTRTLSPKISPRTLENIYSRNAKSPQRDEYEVERCPRLERAPRNHSETILIQPQYQDSVVAGSNKDFGITVRRPSLKCTLPKIREVEKQCQIIRYDKIQFSMSI